MAVADYLVDTSAWARLPRPEVAAVLRPLVERALVATATVLDLEILFSTRTPDEYEAVRQERGGLEPVATTQAEWDRAADVQRQLARHSMTRAVGLADLLVAAIAEAHGLVLVHYDADFDHVSRLTAQPTRWVVPRGSVP